MEDWRRETIKELREDGCNKLADYLIEDYQIHHEHYMEPIMQTGEHTVLYGCDCGIEFEEVVEE
jgi:hypothetical protein